ncbi:DUF6907 domain-containing protein [Amycolatopsis sp. NPDC003861]
MKKTTQTPSWLRVADVVSCPPWCNVRHKELQDTGSRQHWSRLRLQFEPVLAEPKLEHLHEVYGGTQLVPVEVVVDMNQGFRDIGPEINISRDGSEDLVLTVAEAEQVGRMLLKLAKQARKAEGVQR